MAPGRSSEMVLLITVTIVQLTAFECQKKLNYVTGPNGWHEKINLKLNCHQICEEDITLKIIYHCNENIKLHFLCFALPRLAINNTTKFKSHLYYYFIHIFE